MKISDTGIALLKQLEGWKPTVYADSSGYPTIGFGHLIQRAAVGVSIDAPLRKWMELATALYPTGLSLEAGTDLLKSDLEHYEAGVFRMVKVPLKQNQFDALVCFTFNVGLIAFLTSTMLRRLNAGDYDIGSEFLKWCKARNKVTREQETVPGLLNRRKLEKDLYERL